MPNDPKNKSNPIDQIASTKASRRGVLMGGTALAAGLSSALFMPKGLSAADFPTAEVNTTGLAVTDDKVTIGILHSITGTMAISETGSVQAEKLAIEQINAQGGILGRQIDFIQEDGASDWPTFAEKARKLLVNDKVASVMGCWTSASRKAVLPVFEQHNGFLYYPTFYEGLEQSPNVIYTGQEATQQIIAGIDWVTETKGAKSFYLLGSDYIWPRTSNKIARKHIEKLGLEVVGEEYYPLGHTQFNSVINKIRLKKPDVIYAIVVGGSNVAFYKQLKAAGIDMTKEAPVLLTISVTEDEIRGIGGENIVGAYACMKYFQSLENPNNTEFVQAFKDMWGADIVIDRRCHPGSLSRPLALEGRRRKGRLLRHRQDPGSFPRHRIRQSARGLRQGPRKPPPLVQNPRRSRQGRRPIRGRLRNRRPRRTRPLPRRLPIGGTPPALTCRVFAHDAEERPAALSICRP